MSYRKLDEKGKPVSKNGKNKAAVRGEGDGKLYHYAVAVSIKQDGGKYKSILRHAWLPNDAAADEFQRQLKRQPSARALTWQDAFDRWIDDNKVKRSPRHIENVEATMRRWIAAFGATKTIGGTELGEYTTWIMERSKSGKGRGAQLDHSHLLAVARWARERGLVTEVPFDHAPKPEDRTEKRAPAAVNEFHQIAEVLPEHLSLLWRLLGLTGMRLGAACVLMESDITDQKFTVTTKGKKRVTYQLTPPTRDIIKKARQWKVDHGFVGKPYLFCNARGEMWNSKSIGNRLGQIIEKENNAIKKAGGTKFLPKVTAHQLRHLAGTVLGNENFEVPTIMAALGHSNPASSQVYIDKTQTMRNKAMDSLIKNLSKSDPQQHILTVEIDTERLEEIENGIDVDCPCCSAKLLIILKKKA